MKATMLSKKELDYLEHHLHKGLESTLRGLDIALQQKLITLSQHDKLMRAAIERHLTLWHQFTTKLMSKTVCLLFASLFTFLQVQGNDMELRRASRRRNETEQPQ